MFERANDAALFDIHNWPDNAGTTIVRRGTSAA
jgi:hypothetical protein